MPDVARSATRNQLYDFHATPSLHSWSQMYQRQDEGITSVLDLQGKRIVVLAGSVQFDYVASLANSFGIRAPLISVNDLQEGRSEERRVGKECVSTCRSRWSPYH